MDLYIDVGNTHIVFGILKNLQEKNEEIANIIDKNLEELRFSTKNIDTAEDIYKSLFPFLYSICIKAGKFEIDNLVISSVVPQVNFAIERFIEKYCISNNVLWIEARSDLGIDWQTEDYKQMGADRVADILGGICLYNDNFCIIDFGTAITIDVIYNRKYLGGSISPGFMLLIKSLFQETAKLPMVEIKPVMKILDNTTIGQIQLGTIDIICKGINSIIECLSNEYSNLRFILTGGFSSVAKELVKHDHVVPKLQFIGMYYYVQKRIKVC